jgi:CDP-paratose 2-epimerase
MNYLVTGGCGFLGSNITSRLLHEGRNVTVFDDLSRAGAAENLRWLQAQGDLDFVRGDIRIADDVEQLVLKCKPGVVFHVAGQVAMTTSLNDPRRDFEINALGTLNLLESLRQHRPDAVAVYSSTNKVYGDLAWLRLEEEPTRYTTPDFPNGVSESAPLDFHTPYGCSKGAADQYMLDYARCFGLRTAVFRHSTIYGTRQFATFDQGWIGWFCRQAVETGTKPERDPFTIAGNGKQVRDLLFADDAVACYLAAAEQIEKARGQAFNIGGGIANSMSLLELFAMLEELLGVKLRYRQTPWRMDDQKVFVADTAKAKRLMGWEPLVTKETGVRRMLDWIRAS